MALQSRKSTGFWLWLFLCVVDVSLTFGLFWHMHLLQTERPTAPDPARGYVIREVRTHDDSTYYVSRRDKAQDFYLLATCLIWNVVMAVVVYRYTKLRRQQDLVKGA